MGNNQAKKEMIENNSEGKSGKWIIILGYLFAVLGGLIGIILGISLLTKIKAEDGTKRYVYKKKSRHHGIVIIIIATICTMIGAYMRASKPDDESLLRQQKIIEQILFAPMDVQNNTITLFSNDSSFSIKVPSTFVQRQSPDKNALLYCSVSDTIEMLVYADTKAPLDVFRPEFHYTDRSLFPVERMETCRTTKKFDSITDISYYEQTVTDPQNGNSIRYYTSYQHQATDQRNYTISVIVHQNYPWDFDKMTEVSTSIKVNN